jgi:preprotein translocase subunit SecA
LYKRDVNYLVENGEILIVDEFTGRKMPGRRWSDGLHQAIEAKEGVEIQEENQTLATISYQNYFRLYKKLAGMTGTADTEAEEFHKIYKLEVVVIPTNKPMIRKDRHDLVYKNEKGKFRAVVDEIETCHRRGQPVLVGTVSVEKSEVVASLLRKKGIAHNVLNAKQHEREAHVVAQAGRKGAVTIATNMAGRGTDIILGGNAEFMARAAVDPEAAGQPGALVDPEKFQEAYTVFKPQCDAERSEVLTAGGLQIIGTERHESRRIDNQLRGRSGRQGDPGGSLFYLSLEDDLMRIFGAERIKGLMERLGMEEDVPIEAGLINRAIENAQKKVEGHHFDMRKNLLEYDDVMNQQRKTIYALRRQVLEGRYQPTLSEAEIKAGKVASVASLSGGHTIESLAKIVRPLLARMADSLTEPPPAADPAHPPVPIPLDPDLFRSTIYRQFGTYLDVTGITSDRTLTLDKLATSVAGMLIQQRERILDVSEEVLQELVDTTCATASHAEDWDLDVLRAGMKERFGFEPTISTKGVMEIDKLTSHLWDEVEKIIEAREEEFGLPFFLYFARHFMLEEIDQRWIEHLKNMEALREGIYLRGYGQKDPKQEYKKEGFAIFGEMMTNISRNVCEKLFHIQIKREETAATAQHLSESKPKPRRMIESSGGTSTQAAASEPEEARPVRRSEPKVGRNDLCPCGSGKKYKKCHGA